MTEPSHRPSYVPALDGLRAVAVLLVMWGHVPPTVPGYPEWLFGLRLLLNPGDLGVEVFFVLSGFLITRILLAERRRQQPVGWFLIRRVLRIFPIYYLLLAVMAFVQPGPMLIWGAFYLSNVYLVDHTDACMLPHTWSLCVEEHFYLLWPLVVAWLPVQWPRRVMLYLVLPFAVVGAFLVCHWFDPPRSVNIVKFISPFRFFGLGLGCMLAFAEPALARRPGRSALLGVALLAAGVALWPGFWLLKAPEWFGFALPARYAVALGLCHSGVLCAGVVLTVLAGQFAESPLVRPFAWWLPRSIGRISYGLYLYHFPLYTAVFAGGATVGKLVLALALVFGVATASYQVIERPLLRIGARFRG